MRDDAHNLDQLSLYDANFYAKHIDGSSRSAKKVVPEVMRIFPQIKSVVDIGCGAGTWLSEFKKQGIDNVLGLDGGSPTKDSLVIGPDEYRKQDLTARVDPHLEADLVISLEVAQHLDRKYAGAFVKNICSVSDLVLFSAAIPGQGGTHHVNERWPSYWADLFRENGYQFLDLIRGNFWHDRQVEWWYRQNLFFAISNRNLYLIQHIKEYQFHNSVQFLDCAHPQLYLDAISKREEISREAEELRGCLETLERQVDDLTSSLSWRLMEGPRRVLSFLQKFGSQ